MLDDWQREDGRGSAAQQIRALCFATDGSAKKEKPGQAGWGYTACLLNGTPAEVLDAAASTTSAAQALYEESGRVVTKAKMSSRSTVPLPSLSTAKAGSILASMAVARAPDLRPSAVFHP